MKSKQLYFHTLEEAEIEMKKKLEEIQNMSTWYGYKDAQISRKYILKDDGEMIKVYYPYVSQY